MNVVFVEQVVSCGSWEKTAISISSGFISHTHVHFVHFFNHLPQIPFKMELGLAYEAAVGLVVSRYLVK